MKCVTVMIALLLSACLVEEDPEANEVKRHGQGQRPPTKYEITYKFTFLAVGKTDDYPTGNLSPVVETEGDELAAIPPDEPEPETVFFIGIDPDKKILFIQSVFKDSTTGGKYIPRHGREGCVDVIRNARLNKRYHQEDGYVTHIYTAYKNGAELTVKLTVSENNQDDVQLEDFSYKIEDGYGGRITFNNEDEKNNYLPKKEDGIYEDWEEKLHEHQKCGSSSLGSDS